MSMAKRGPSYPAFGLKEAIERARQLHRQDGSAPTAPEVAVRAWGYGSLNGVSLRVLSALKQYGLLESAGDNVKLTERALAIILEPEGSTERTAAIQAAVSAPSIFGTIAAEYQGELPSDAALVSYLVRRQGFQERAAQRLVEAFRETVELAKESPVPQITETGQPPVQKLASDTGRGNERAVIEQQSGRPGSGEGDRMEFKWPLSGDAVAVLTVTKSVLDADDIEILVGNFQLATKVLRKAAQRLAAAQSPAPTTVPASGGGGDA